MPAPKKNDNSRTHGMYSLRDSGPSSIQDPAKIGRLAELRALVRTETGRQDIREELTARMALIVDFGFSHLAEQQRQGVDIFGTDVMKRLQGYVAETRRLLDSFGQLDPGASAERERIRKVLNSEPIKRHVGNGTGGEDSE